MEYKKVKIVGIGGEGRTGKDTLAELFLKRGFFGFSFGDRIREYCQERHASDPHPISRVNMTETSNYMREKFGPDFLLKEALEKFEAASANKKYEGALLYSIRAPIEVDFILNHGGTLIYIDASEETRYKRYKLALRAGEPELSFNDFVAQESLSTRPQPGIPAEIQMSAVYVKEKATVVFNNDFDNLEEFIAKANELVDSIVANN